jgi:hypothetical protein
MNSNHKWIESIEHSLDGVQQPEVNPYLYSKIVTRLQTKQEEQVSYKLVWVSACSLALLVLVNVMAFRFNHHHGQTTNKELGELTTVLHLVNDNAINYN